MPKPRFDDFVFDDDNDAKFAEHGITSRQVADVLYESEFTVRRNRRHRSGLYLVIGRDLSGNCIAIPIEATIMPAVWRPVTAWPCKTAEEAQLKR